MKNIKLLIKTVQIKLRASVIIEIILAISILSIMILGLASSISYSLINVNIETNEILANQLLDEGLEVVKDIQKNNFVSLIDGTHGINLVANKWEFSGSLDITNGYTRQVQISTIDTNTKQATVTISWGTPAKSISASQYYTNWQRTIITTSWANPSLQGSLDLAGNADANAIQYKNNYIFITRPTNTNSFQVIDATVSSVPTLAVSLNFVNNPTDLCIDNSKNYAYVILNSGLSEIRIVNVTNPISPINNTNIDIPGTNPALKCKVDGNFLYVTKTQSGTAGNNEFFIYNITVPSTPVLVGQLNIALPLTQIAINGNYAYIASTDNTSEIVIINITNPSLPTLAASYNLSGNQDAIAIELINPTVLAVGRANGDLVTFDITIPASLSILGTLATSSQINDIVLGPSPYMFLGTSGSITEFQVVNISNTSAITLENSVNLSQSLLAVVYDSIRDLTYSASTSNTEELIILKPN